MTRRKCDPVDPTRFQRWFVIEHYHSFKFKIEDRQREVCDTVHHEYIVLRPLWNNIFYLQTEQFSS